GQGLDLLRKAPDSLNDVGFGRLVEQQAIVLCQWIASTPDKGAVPSKTMKQGAEMAIAGTTGIVGDWLKSTFREQARRASHQGSDICVHESVAHSMQLVAGAIYSKSKVRSGSVDAQRMVIQGLDMVILAASIAGTKTATTGIVDELLVTGMVCWLLPLLTGLGAQAVCCQSAAASRDGRQALLVVAAEEMLQHMERSAGRGQAVVSSEQQQPTRQYSAQLRTRVLGLLDLTQSAAPQRALRLVLVHLAQLGMLPLTELQRVV
ncbi:hypothetical protein GGH95_005730, partial [Coemansia sp. RSA 1836]